jgi:ABC-type sugar transport system substrate-binding protein
MDALADGMRARLGQLGMTMRQADADLRAQAPIDSQARALHQLHAEAVDGLVLFSIDLKGPAAAMRAIHADNIPLVTIHSSASPVSGSLIVPNFYQGMELARAVVDAAGTTRRPRIGVVGPPAILDDIEFTEGVLAVLHRLGAEPANDPFDSACRNLSDTAGTGRDAVKHVLTAFGQLHGLVVFNDETMRDAIEVLADRKQLGALPAASRNGSPDMVEAVKQGQILGTFDYQLPEIGHQAAELVAQVLSEPSPSRMRQIAPIGQLITQNTVQDYRAWDERVQPVECAQMHNCEV